SLNSFTRVKYIVPTSLVLTKFTNTMVKSRPLKDIGAEQVLACRSDPASHLTCLYQLLIDLQTVKACLLKLPGDSLTTSRYMIFEYQCPLAEFRCSFSYTRSLTKSTARLEALLKVIVTPVVRCLLL